MVSSFDPTTQSFLSLVFAPPTPYRWSTSISRKADSLEQLLDRSTANGDEPGVYELEDSVRNTTTHVDKTFLTRIAL